MVTFRVSPVSTALEPDVKSPALYRRPDVPVATVQIPAPATVAALVMLNETVVAVLEPAVVVPQVMPGRFPVYGFTSSQPEWEARVSPAAADPVPLRSRNQPAV
jgi:hypothetical protein